MFQLKLFKSSKRPETLSLSASLGNNTSSDERELLLMEITARLLTLEAKGAPKAISNKVNSQYSLLLSTQTLLHKPSSIMLRMVSENLKFYATMHTVTKAKPGSIRYIAQQAINLQTPLIAAANKIHSDKMRQLDAILATTEERRNAAKKTHSDKTTESDDEALNAAESKTESPSFQ